MSLGKIKKPRGFRPQLGGAGSVPGKPQGRWPLVLVVVADALFTRAKGTQESWLIDRDCCLTSVQFNELMDGLCPGWSDWYLSEFGARKTTCSVLLKNRVYKMYYSGTSDRGKRHDPYTRATYSREHWTRKIPAGHPLRDLYQNVLHGKVVSIPNWRTYL